MSEEVLNVAAKTDERSLHDQTASSTTEPEIYNFRNNIEMETISCFVLTKDQTFRRWFIRLVRWPWFERISMFVIIANCITLAMYDPFDNKCRTSKCKALEILEKCVFAFFSLEMVIKMVAMGVIGRKGYLQDKWNRLDFLIVLVGVIETAMLGNDSVLTIIRAFRVLRPLRAINRVPSIRILVTLLLDTLPMLGNVLMLSFLMFFVFGIVGVQLWQGQLRNRCFMGNSTSLAQYSLNLTNYYTPSFEKPDYICSLPSQNGMLRCTNIPPYYENDQRCTRTPTHEQLYGNGIAVANVTECVDWNSLYTECRAEGPNPFHQAVSFDNIGISWIVIFQVITMEGWSDIMYFVQDSHHFWDWIYFVILIVSGSFFLVNLCLVVITMQFQETKQRELEMMEENRRQEGLRNMHTEHRGLCFFWKTLLDCFRKKRPVNEHVHYHHHHVYHHHLHHHLYNCFVPTTPNIFGSVHSDEDKLHMENLQIPGINVESPEQDEEILQIMDPSSHLLQPPTLEERLGRDSKSPLCSHSVSIHAEATSSLSVNLSPNSQSRLTTEAKSNVSLAFAPSLHKARSNSINSVCSDGSVVTSLASGPTFTTTSAFSCQGSEANCQECEILSRKSSLRRQHQTHSHSMSHVYKQNCFTSPSKGNSRQNSKREKQNQSTSDKLSGKASALPSTLDVYSNTLYPDLFINCGYQDSNCESQTESRAPTPTHQAKKKIGALDVLALKGALSLVKKDERPPYACKASPLEEEETPNADTNVKEHHTRSDEVCDHAQQDDESLYADSIFDLQQSDFYSVAAKIDIFQKLRNWCRRTTESKFFMHFVMVVIMVNMICMSLEHYQQPEQLTKALDITNLVFVIIFTVEMALKLLGLGFTLYLSQCQNVFDGFIVLVSVLEILIQNGSGISLSIFRSIRLLRIFKLVRPVRYQLLVMVRTMTSVITFFALFFLFMFAFAILGMNLFGSKFRFTSNEGHIVTARSNFDNFLWAMITVFQILTQENWNLVMYNGIRSVGMWSATYFIALMTIGYYVLFNLLVAILVEGFTGSESRRGPKEENSKISENSNEGMRENKNPVACDCHLTNLTVSNLTEKEGNRPCPGTKNDQSTEYCVRGVRNALGSTLKMKTTYNPVYNQGRESMSLKRERMSPKFSTESVDCPLTMPELKRMRQTNISIVRRTRKRSKDDLIGSLDCGFSRLNEEHQTTLTRSMTVPDCLSLGLETKHNPAYEPDDDGITIATAVRSTDEVLLDNNLKLDTDPSTFKQSCLSHERTMLNCNTADFSRGVLHEEQFLSCKNLPSEQQQGSDEMAAGITPDRSVVQEHSITDQRAYIQSLQEFSRNHLRSESSGRKDWSLFVFSPKNRLREYLAIICCNKWFDYTVLFFILLSCIVLAMEEPSDTPTSRLKRQLIDTSMFVFTIIFTLEMMMKVIASGLVIGPKTYLRDGWNILDGLLVLVSWLDVILTHTPLNAPDIVGTLRVFRAFRTLRPLRVIRRAPGLKLVVETLLYSLKPIGNTVLIAAIFFLIFGILGVQLFKGMFYYCEGDDHVVDKIECNNSTRGLWVNQLYNFDNLLQALISLFVFSTKDGWIEIMLHGIDAVGVDKQPVVNYAEWRLLYFIPFLLLGGFLVINMIVGVVVENFQRARQRQVKEDGSKKRKRSKNKSEHVGRKAAEDENYFRNYSPVRRGINYVCTHIYWDVSIAVVICVNVICMSLEHYQMSKFYVVFVETTNYFFTAVFVIEVAMRLIAVGCNRYVKDRWNLVDLLIVALSVAGIFLQEINSQDFKVNPSIIRALRVLRIVRVLKLVKLARGVRSLLDTILEALPQVGNLGLLFLLLFFIYSCLGIQLFGTLECSHDYPCQGMGPHAHFRDFGTTMLTLFRIATGDNWNGILKDTLRTRCSSSTSCTKNCCVSKYSAPLFFITFVLVAQFVLVNVVIAVLMKHLKESKEKIAANIAARNIETKLRLVTLAARRFIQTRARRTSQAIARRRSVVEIGLSGIELAQLKSHTSAINKSFYVDMLKSDALFQEFLQLKSSLRKAKMRANRTTSHNMMESSEKVLHEHLKRRRNTIAAIHYDTKVKSSS